MKLHLPLKSCVIILLQVRKLQSFSKVKLALHVHGAMNHLSILKSYKYMNGVQMLKNESIVITMDPQGSTYVQGILKSSVVYLFRSALVYNYYELLTASIYIW